MKVKLKRYEVLRPKSVGEAVSYWVKSDSGNTSLQYNPHMSQGEVESRCLTWLLEDVEVNLNEMNGECKIGYWRDGVRYTDPLELAKVIIEDAQNSIAKGN